MTVVIGSQTDVPDSGDPIVSPWYQDTARKLVHNFATITARNAWTTRPEGAVAYTVNDNKLTYWDGAAWIEIVQTPSTSALFVGSNVTVGSSVGAAPDGRLSSTIDGAGNTGNPNLNLTRRGSTGTPGGASEPFAWFRRSASVTTPADTTIGSITINGGVNGVLFNTTSDPRIKTREGDIDDAAERIQTLGRAAFRGRMLHGETGEPTGDQRDLLSSHDIEDVAAYAVTGERDAVDDDGTPVYQQVAYGELVPLLVAALADALDRIDALEGAS